MYIKVWSLTFSSDLRKPGLVPGESLSPAINFGSVLEKSWIYIKMVLLFTCHLQPCHLLWPTYVCWANICVCPVPCTLFCVAILYDVCLQLFHVCISGCCFLYIFYWFAHWQVCCCINSDDCMLRPHVSPTLLPSWLYLDKQSVVNGLGPGLYIMHTLTDVCIELCITGIVVVLPPLLLVIATNGFWSVMILLYIQNKSDGTSPKHGESWILFIIALPLFSTR